jgi:nicotinic acid mononucleotide adenylyltransferase
MTGCACASWRSPLRDVELCMIERSPPQPNYTLTTLQALAARHPDVQLRLVLGTDLEAETHAWHDFDTIRALAPPLGVTPRSRGTTASRLCPTSARPKFAGACWLANPRRASVAGRPTTFASTACTSAADAECFLLPERATRGMHDRQDIG